MRRSPRPGATQLLARNHRSRRELVRDCTNSEWGERWSSVRRPGRSRKTGRGVPECWREMAGSAKCWCEIAPTVTGTLRPPDPKPGWGFSDAEATDRRTDEVRDRHRQGAADDVAGDGPSLSGSRIADPRADESGEREREYDGDEGDRDPAAVRREDDREDRQQRTDDERDRGRDDGMPRTHQVVGVDAELDVEVRAQRVLRGELLGDLARCPWRQPPALVELGQLLELSLWHRGELVLLLGDE